MKCVLCKTGVMQPGVATVTLERNQTVVVIKGVPAEVCQNCGDGHGGKAALKHAFDGVA